MKSSLDRTHKITYTAIMIALAVSLRLMKHMLFGNLQFINFPAIFTITSGILFGPVMGATVGVTSFLISDIMIGMPGPWTLVNALLMGLFGGLSGLIWKKVDNNFSKIAMGIVVYLIIFAYDILSSWILNMVIGFPPLLAFVWGFLGLFIPVPISGGFMFGIGPITEATSAIVVAAIVALLLRSGIGRRQYQGPPPVGEEKKKVMQTISRSTLGYRCSGPDRRLRSPRQVPMSR
jgi:LytS/YehU family sensor histidine kinase